MVENFVGFKLFSSIVCLHARNLFAFLLLGLACILEVHISDFDYPGSVTASFSQVICYLS